MAERGFQRLAQRHDFLMHGVIGGRLAVLAVANGYTTAFGN
jgi:hypothetical protein